MRARLFPITATYPMSRMRNAIRNQPEANENEPVFNKISMFTSVVYSPEAGTSPVCSSISLRIRESSPSECTGASSSARFLSHASNTH